jgi:hypothetical protein
MCADINMTSLTEQALERTTGAFVASLNAETERAALRSAERRALAVARRRGSERRGECKALALVRAQDGETKGSVLTST